VLKAKVIAAIVVIASIISLSSAYLMLQDIEAAGDDLVLQDGAIGNVQVFTVVCNDDDSTLKGHVGAKDNVSRGGEVVEFDYVGCLALESLLVLAQRCEVAVVTELDDWQ